jgi:hypothetical protein
MTVRYLDFAKTSYVYQRRFSSEVSGERNGVALLSGWYAIISEKKVWRIDFIKAFCRAFDVDLSTKRPVCHLNLTTKLADHVLGRRFFCPLYRREPCHFGVQATR